MLLPSAWRAAVGALTLLGAVGFGLLAWRYAGRRSAGVIDGAVGRRLVEHVGQPLGDTLWLVTLPGSALGLLLGLIGLGWAAARRSSRRRAAVLLALGGPLLAVALTAFVLKPLVGRTHDGDLSMPSGHATAVTSLAWVLLLVLVAAGRPRAPWLRAVLVVAAALGVFGVVVAMVALQRHYLTDMLAGACVGTAVVGGLAWLLDGPAGARGRNGSGGSDGPGDRSAFR